MRALFKFLIPKAKQRQAHELLALTDIDFLKTIVARYPETQYLAGKAEASPEGNPVLKEDALAYQVFGSNVEIDPTAIEADRTFLGLLTLKWVLTDQYGKFTSLQRNPATRLTRNSFDSLRDYTKRVTSTDADLEFCLYSLACNDLGKTLFLVSKHIELTGKPAEDHDQLLGRLMNIAPQLFPAYQNLLTAEQQKQYVEGIEANLNLGQFVQAENLPINLVDIQKISQKSRELRLVCELFDFAGVNGHQNPNGSTSMTEDNYLAMSRAIEELTKEPLSESYRRYIAGRGAFIGIDCNSAEDYALCRIAALSRAFTKEQGDTIKTVWNGLPEAERSLLTAELNTTGVDGRKGILVYYAPALISNAVQASENFETGLEYGLKKLLRVYHSVSEAGYDREGNGIITMNVAKEAIRANWESVLFAGDRLAFIGGGGGSDAIQAAVLAILSGKSSCVISVRTDKTQSQNTAGQIGEKRKVSNHGGEIAPGVFRMKPDTAGSGRFLENIPASRLPTYLVIDSGDGRLRDQLQAVISDFGGVSTVIDVDTGGDCLYRSQVDDATKATPDQDIATLRAVCELEGYRLLTCVLANGIDSPDYAADVLKQASAAKITFTDVERRFILDLYREFQMDGSHPDRYGKTPFAWQAALRGEIGRVRIPLPDSVVNDARNPWNPYVIVTDEMAGGYVMHAKNHLKVIDMPADRFYASENTV